MEPVSAATVGKPKAMTAFPFAKQWHDSHQAVGTIYGVHSPSFAKSNNAAAILIKCATHFSLIQTPIFMLTVI